MSENAGYRAFLAGEALAVSRRVRIADASSTMPPTVVYADAGEQHIGVTTQAAASGSFTNARLRTVSGTVEIEAADSFASGAVLYGAADGKVSDSANGSALAQAIEAAGSGGAIVEVVEFGVLSTTAATVSLADAGGHTAAATVEAALAELYVDRQTAQATLPIPLAAITMEDGTALTKQATTVAGLAQAANKEQRIEIPVDCTAGEALAFCLPLPQDYDEAGDLHVHALVGKGGNLDTLTLDCEVYLAGPGDTGNADACTTAAQAWPQAVTELTFAAAAAGLIAAPATLTAILTLGGTNDGDAVYLYGAWVEYTRKVLAA
ncbi:hypothetical protein [uncultured Thiodictyon sp.]|uniref:hypothetical protein n=1 Tax=uncultured Thiodictyon sp. TaxID=1846217 RepID=UPI0025F18C77|nr:hypothetical protein [uncultured Thiodictyon sp.]